MATSKHTPRSVAAGPPVTGMTALRQWYKTAVARLAAELRPRFESGELREWREGDHEAYAARNFKGPQPPLFRIENECGHRFLRQSARRAFLVLAVSPSTAKFYDSGATTPWFAASSVMAADVLGYVHGQGWTRRAA